MHDLAPGVSLPEYRVRVRNLSRHAANRIHDDTVARTYGFTGGLVVGTTLYAYLTEPLVATWGLDWLARGTAQLRFARPAYDGEEVRVQGRALARSGNSVAGEIGLEMTVLTPRAEAAVTAVAGLSWGGPPIAPAPDAYRVAPLPAVAPEATPETLAALEWLGSPELTLDAAEAARYVTDVDDPLPIYQGESAAAHPGLLLQQANRILSENVRLGPWIHVASDLAHCGVARVGDRLSTRGRVVRVFERKGRGYVDLDVLVVAGDVTPVLHVRHTAIYRLPERLSDPG